MKSYIPFFVGALFLSCNASTEHFVTDMPGVYQMEYQEVDNGTEKTKNTDLKQLKIYTDNYFMYTQGSREDSTYTFGIGTYKVDKDSNIVTEHVIFSATGSSIDSSGIEYPLSITTNIDGYKQQIPNIKIRGEDVKLTEGYKRSKPQEATPLDGVWKQTAFYTINNNDTTSADFIQYKTFYSGYFMWGQVKIDSSGAPSTAIGFGSFTMPDDTHLKETDLNSTYAIVPGQTFDIDIEMMGDNKYKQTLANNDGSKNVEIYERIGK